MKPKTVHFIGKKYLAEFKHHVYGKRQIQVDNFSKQKFADKSSSKQFLWIKNCVKLLIYVLKQ